MGMRGMKEGREGGMNDGGGSLFSFLFMVTIMMMMMHKRLMPRS